MKKIVAIIIGSFIFQISVAQITIEPEEWLPCEEITITIDITQGDCDRLVDNEGPLYLWTWAPAGPVAGNGEWSNSNEDMLLTNTGPNLWSITMVPTEFYGVSADEVYANGFAMLVKGKDGLDGTDCNEQNKTADYTLTVAPPFKSQKLFARPAAVFPEDVFTFYYDNTLETKESMQNLDEVYVYAAAISNGIEYPVSDMSAVGDNPNLRMSEESDGLFRLSIIPEIFFTGVPAGQEIQQLLFIARKKVMNDLDDRVEEDAVIDLGCEAAAGGC